MPQAPNYWGALKSTNKVTSTLKPGRFALKELKVRTWGRLTYFLPRAPSKGQSTLRSCQK